MPLSRPSLTEIKNRHETDIRSELGSGPFLDGSFLKSLSNANAGAFHGQYGYLETISKEALPANAVNDFLTNWAKTYGISRIAATYAAGNVIFTGENSTAIPAGTQLIGDNDIVYSTNALGTISSGTATIAITALAPGAAGNLAAGVTIGLLSPIAGIDNTVTVASGGLASGSDQESDISLRSRILARIQSPPHGGNQNDYEGWALSIAGIAKAWVLPFVNGAGSVNIYIVTADEDNLTPADDKITEVYDYITAPSRKPITAKVAVVAPSLVETNFDIRITPDTAEVRAAVEASLKELIKRERKPGVQVSSTTTEGYTLPISKIREAVSTAAGEVDNVVNSPSADVEFEIGEIPIYGETTWE